jgi:hypothetical protein
VQRRLPSAHGFAAPTSESAPVAGRSPDDVVALIPVLGKDLWLTDAWRSAITFDLHDVLATVGVPVLALLGHLMDRECHGAAALLAEERDPVAAAHALPNVKTVITLGLARTTGDVELTVTMTGRSSRRRFHRAGRIRCCSTKSRRGSR